MVAEMKHYDRNTMFPEHNIGQRREKARKLDHQSRLSSVLNSRNIREKEQKLKRG